MRIAAFGAGGVGGFLAARLAAAGHSVAVVARGSHLQAMRDAGLRLISPSGDLTVQPDPASDDPAAIGPVDLVIFAVKMTDAEAAATRLSPLLGPETLVLTVLNGVDSVDLLARTIGRERVLGGTAYISSHIDAPGVIRQVGERNRFQIGELDADVSPRVADLVDAWRAAGIDAEASPRIVPEIWEKLVALAALAGVTAVTRATIGRVREDPEARGLVAQAMAETTAVARAAGVAVAPDIVDRQMAMLDKVPHEMKSSLQVDLERGRPLELPWLSGAVVRRGTALGVPTPVHRFLHAALRLHVDGRRQ